MTNYDIEKYRLLISVHRFTIFEFHIFVMKSIAMIL